ncbi:MAG TPA: hypothetical protein VJH63_02425 [Candidatus Paceibacterota bacterium]
MSIVVLSIVGLAMIYGKMVQGPHFSKVIDWKQKENWFKAHPQ